MSHAIDPASAESPTVAIEHGGDLEAARRLFPDAPAPWIDLSTGINPNPYPIGPIDPASFARLPSPAAARALEAAAAIAYGVADPRTVLAAPGAQSLIQTLPHVLAGRCVGVLGQTYCEHAAAWRRAGREIVACSDPESLERCDIAVIVNPNNPDGRLASLDTLSKLARRTRLVVDESFMDLTPDASFAAAAPAAGAVVLRSFGKTFGLAGIRLGFAIAPQETIASLREALGPWAVSGPAIEIGRRALTDTDWLDAARLRLARNTQRLDALLAGAGFRALGGTALFRLAERADAAAVWEILGRAGIFVRRFADRPRWLRFGLPADEHWPRVEAALTQMRAHAP